MVVQLLEFELETQQKQVVVLEQNHILKGFALENDFGLQVAEVVFAKGNFYG
jgi:hypothetical protein